ncbi:MAG: AarF/ABC1/UbiB kinase family protein [Cuniculiplasma sp.]|nr:AarF/ABC1/UbiB kinase family protein [Cuniculiplasma sp.]
MEEDRDILKGIFRREVRVFFLLYPAFRRFQKDRKSAKSEGGKDWDYRRERNGKKAVQLFIELGPAFIKLGQILSARPDLLPKEYISSFEKLQDSVPPSPFEEVRPTLEENLGKLDEVFDNFDREAISGASLGQVYRATYKGKDVAVKVNRPDAEFIVKRDIVILDRILRFARGRIENFLYLSINNVLRDFRKRIIEEMNYEKEASNSKRIARNISGREKIIVPRVYDELSSKQVLVMDYISGTKITDVRKLKEKNIDIQKLAYDLDISFIRMLLRDDIFHADPHPGNISVTDSGEIILYDFGMVGDLDDNTRYYLLSLYDGLTRGDIDQIVDSLIGVKALSPAANRGVIKKSVELGMAGMSGKRAEDSEIRELLEIANDVVFEFPFRLPTSLVLYMRMSSLLEGICLSLDPEFKFVKVLRKLFMEEGLLKELYEKQISMFMEDSIRSIEAGVAILPLLRRKLESEEEKPLIKKRQSIPMAIFGGFLILSGIYEYGKIPDIGYLLFGLGFLFSLFSVIRRE